MRLSHGLIPSACGATGARAALSVVDVALPRLPHRPFHGLWFLLGPSALLGRRLRSQSFRAKPFERRVMYGLLGPDEIVVGIAWVRLRVPGARTLKDRRRAVVSLRDRLRARSTASVNEVAGHDHAGESGLVITMGGLEASPIEAALDRLLAEIHATPDVVVASVEREVRQWPDPIPWEDDDG